MILKNESNNAKYNFLKYEDDVYRPYYLQMLKQYTEELEANQPKEEENESN